MLSEWNVPITILIKSNSIVTLLSEKTVNFWDRMKLGGNTKLLKEVLLKMKLII